MPVVAFTPPEIVLCGQRLRCCTKAGVALASSDYVYRSWECDVITPRVVNAYIEGIDVAVLVPWYEPYVSAADMLDGVLWKATDGLLFIGAMIWQRRVSFLCF